MTKMKRQLCSPCDQSYVKKKKKEEGKKEMIEVHCGNKGGMNRTKRTQ